MTPVQHRGYLAIGLALRPPGTVRAISVNTIKRWFRRAVDPLPLRHDHNGWYIWSNEAASWVSRQDLPGQAYDELLRLRRKFATGTRRGKRSRVATDDL